MRESNFNFVAPFYDGLARLIFKDQLREAKSSLLTSVRSGERILLLGGGTGELLELLDDLNIPLQIVYLEYSQKMLDKAKERSFGKQLDVEFFHKSVFGFNEKEEYDVVITNFFLDVFAKEELLKVIDLIYPSLKQGGSWIVTDFQKDSIGFKNRVLLKLMFVFFTVFSRLQSNEIFDFDKLLKSKGLNQRQEKLFMKAFIFSRQYIK